MSAPPIATTRVEGGDGLRTRRKSASLLREVRGEGRGRQFENHLAILQQASDRHKEARAAFIQAGGEALLGAGAEGPA